MAELTHASLLEVLQTQFGYPEFRPGQEKVIWDLLHGRDALAVLPTGSGKSLLYQLTALLLPGITVVVSPLIALMKDQVASVGEKGIQAFAISSAQSEGQI